LLPADNCRIATLHAGGRVTDIHEEQLTAIRSEVLKDGIQRVRNICGVARKNAYISNYYLGPVREDERLARQFVRVFSGISSDHSRAYLPAVLSKSSPKYDRLGDHREKLYNSDRNEPTGERGQFMIYLQFLIGLCVGGVLFGLGFNLALDRRRLALAGLLMLLGAVFSLTGYSALLFGQLTGFWRWLGL